MSTTSPGPLAVNYAKFVGIQSVAAAAVFAALYVVMLFWYTFQSIRRPTYVYVVLALFCGIRVSAFVIRAILAGSSTAGTHLGLLITDQVLFGVGFFGLLYSAYTLVLDRELLTQSTLPKSPLLRLTSNKRLFRTALVAGVALGIASSSMTNNDGSVGHTAQSLRKASIIIFLVLAVLQAFQTLVLVRAEIMGAKRATSSNSVGATHGIFVLLAISLLLLIRQVFVTATMNNSAKQNNEHLWYPLLALPEILAVFLYATPGLVPSRKELEGLRVAARKDAFGGRAKEEDSA